MKERLTRWVPLGLDPAQELGWAGKGLLASLVPALWFPGSYIRAYQALFIQMNHGRILQEGAVMEPFSELLGWSFAGFFTLAAGMAALALYHVLYHYQGSKSIYLMRRVPNQWEFWRRCLALPVVCAAVSLTAALLLLLVYYAIYRIATPDVCLLPGQWAAVWGA